MNSQSIAAPSSSAKYGSLPDYISRLWILMRREMWENRIGFIWTPLVISALTICLSFMALFMAHKIDSKSVTTIDMLRIFATEVSMEEKVNIVSGAMLGFHVLFGAVLFIVTVFYLLGALYDDRKDRSILFWKSLPISDSMTVVSKLATATLLMPALFLIATIATQLFLLCVASAYALMADISPWANFWQPAQLLSNWLIYILGALIQALWLLPVWAWLLFCSSFAPRVPFLFAVAIPLLLAWVQKYLALIQSFDFNSTTILFYIAQRITNAVLPLNVQARVGDGAMTLGLGESDDARELFDHALSLQYLWERLLDPSLWVGLMIALVFIVASVYFRRRATDQ